jgi:hypothetical protein
METADDTADTGIVNVGQSDSTITNAKRKLSNRIPRFVRKDIVRAPFCRMIFPCCKNYVSILVWMK